MADRNKYPYVSVAYKSRFVFRTDAGYRRALGVSFETVSNNRDLARDMDMYFGILSREASRVVDKPLDDMIHAYVKASDFYLNLDWGGRSQMASRKRFCRMLYRIYATGGRGLTAEEIVKFKVKDDDERLMQAFFPDGVDGEPAVDVSYIVLFAFGIVRPWHADVSRGRDIGDEEAMRSITKLKSLIEVLKDDMLRLGSTERPLAFDEWLCEIDRRIAAADVGICSVLWMWSTLQTISVACQTMANVQHSRQATESFRRVCAPGIWVDDADRGRERFWIFPYNNVLAFCFRRDGMAWVLHPYEFFVRPRDVSGGVCELFMIDCLDDLEYTFSSDHRAVDLEKICSGGCEFKVDEATEMLTALKVIEENLPLPSWLDWRQWERLSPDDPRHQEFRSVLKSVYDPRNPHSVLFRNLVPEVTDQANNFVGHDKKYLYVYDWRPKRFCVKEIEPDVFAYEGDCRHDPTFDALFEMEISPEHPLYAIPADISGKTYGNAQLDRLAEIMCDAENIKELNIVHSDRAIHPRLLFTSYGASISLDMELLQKVGIKKFTSRPF